MKTIFYQKIIQKARDMFALQTVQKHKNRRGAGHRNLHTQN